MEKREMEEFAQYWNATLQSKGQKPLTITAIAMCFDDLSNYDIGTIKSALKTFRKNPDEGQYSLQVSAIIKIIEGDSKTASNKAWLQALRVANSCGDSDDVVMSDQISMKCIEEMGGLQRLCNQPNDFDLKDYGRAFRTLYEHYRISGMESAPTILKGTTNTQRKLFGLKEIAPRMIGFDRAESRSLPDFSKPRYSQIESGSLDKTRDQVMSEMKKLIEKTH